MVNVVTVIVNVVIVVFCLLKGVGGVSSDSVSELQAWLTLLRKLIEDQGTQEAGPLEGRTGSTTSLKDSTSEFRQTSRSADEVLVTTTDMLRRKGSDDQDSNRGPSMSTPLFPGIEEETRSRIIDFGGLTLPPSSDTGGRTLPPSMEHRRGEEVPNDSDEKQVQLSEKHGVLDQSDSKLLRGVGLLGLLSSKASSGKHQLFMKDGGGVWGLVPETSGTPVTSEGQLIRLGTGQEKESTVAGFITFNVSAIVSWIIDWTGESDR